MKPIPGWTPDEILELAQNTIIDMDNAGVCIECGSQAYNCEPDARKYKCEACGKHAVYGAEELLIMGYCD